MPDKRNKAKNANVLRTIFTMYHIVNNKQLLVFALLPSLSSILPRWSHYATSHKALCY